MASRAMTVRRCLLTAYPAVAVLTGAWLGLAALAGADPGDAMTPPGDPAPAATDADPAPAAAVVPQKVPEIANPVYGSGQYGSGPLGTLRDLWHQAHDPYGMNQSEATVGAAAPPAGAGPAPALPPGYVSINAPGSETASTASTTGGPALPPGYYSLDGPPPPGYEYRQPGGSAKLGGVDASEASGRGAEGKPEPPAIQPGEPAASTTGTAPASGTAAPDTPAAQ
ncbi:hypothetical protein MINS_27540 [Mycolicibacterium insubricum]|uniref:Uncharacterized protein n=1 Tax=Mycolicibacterium insubricum TaxID=444597 RepID=A0A1X0D5M1_9MYCO|nr:hypothetical protein BST26_15515 [Mycolicibacterium insubricum]BBZ67325.1 hypothetical protein MINS_27540 [Mycolicibacterium insubricum]